MDRIQKQLVKTYFRKRNIAIEQSDDMDFYTKYRIYELIYGVENNFIDIGELKKNLDGGNVYTILQKKPQFAKYLKHEFADLKYYMIKLLKRHPQLITHFKDIDELYEVGGDDIADLLYHQPQLIDYFENNLDKLVGFDITKILQTRPQLINYFINRLGEINGENILRILLYQPQLINLFMDNLNRLNKNEITYLLTRQPQLKPYFENISNG